MSKLGRRQSIKLGAAAAVVGPSVLFSRKGSAASKSGEYLKVEIDGNALAVESISKLDLGTLRFDADKHRPSHDWVKVALDSDMPKLVKRLSRHASAKGTCKISVSLYGPGMKQPATTYHVTGAHPVAQPADRGDKAEYKLLWWKGGEIEVINHELSSAKPGVKAQKWVDAHGTLKLEKIERNGKAQKVKLDLATIKVQDRVSLTSVVTSNLSPLASISICNKGQNLDGAALVDNENVKTWKIGAHATAAMKTNKSSPILMLKADTAQCDKDRPVLTLSATSRAVIEADFKFVLVSVDMPKYAKGSTAPITETYNFKVEPGAR